MAWEFTAKKNATIDDTLNYLINAINVDSKTDFVKECVKKLRSVSSDNFTFIHNLFNFVCRNVKYKLDENGTERIFTAQRTVREGMQGADCKKMAGLIAAVLQAAGIDCALKHVYYYDQITNAWKDYTHIYVIVPFPDVQHYITVDPTNDCKWNTEIHHDKATLYFLNGNKMDLKVMGNNNGTKNWGFQDHTALTAGRISDDLAIITGTQSPLYAGALGASIESILSDESTISGIGKKTKEQKKETRKKVIQKFTKGVKQVGLAPIRGAYLEIVRLNIGHTATKLAKAWVKNENDVQNAWKKFGGDPKVLKNTIIKGSKVKISGIGFVLPASVAAALPIFLEMAKVFTKAGIKDKDDEVLAEKIETAAAEHENPAAAGESVKDETTAADTSAQLPVKGGSVTILGMGLLFFNFPLYISVPAIIFVCWHYRIHILSHFTFTNK